MQPPRLGLNFLALGARLGVTDLVLGLLLVLASLGGPLLEESYRELWTYLPLAFAVPLLLSGLLLQFQQRAATWTAMVIHVLVLCVGAPLLLLSLLLVFTIVFTGFGIVVSPPAFVLVANSALTLARARRTLRSPSVEGLARSGL